jgi:hypothetical protein
MLHTSVTLTRKLQVGISQLVEALVPRWAGGRGVIHYFMALFDLDGGGKVRVWKGGTEGVVFVGNGSSAHLLDMCSMATLTPLAGCLGMMLIHEGINIIHHSRQHYSTGACNMAYTTSTRMRLGPHGSASGPGLTYPSRLGI